MLFTQSLNTCQMFKLITGGEVSMTNGVFPVILDRADRQNSTMKLVSDFFFLRTATKKKEKLIRYFWDKLPCAFRTSRTLM